MVEIILWSFENNINFDVISSFLRLERQSCIEAEATALDLNVLVDRSRALAFLMAERMRPREVIESWWAHRSSSFNFLSISRGRSACEAQGAKTRARWGP